MKVYDYTRKSEEDKRRQVQSFEKQIEAINSIIPPHGITFEPVYDLPIQESKTGKKPYVRTYFNEMMDSIEADLERGERIGSRAWKITRYARNAPDASRVINAVQNGLTLFTPYKVFTVNEIGDLYGEFAKAHVYSNDLSIDVKGGLNQKVLAGKRPGRAPLGYRNTPEKPDGLREIQPGNNFDLMQRCWKSLLSMKYTRGALYKVATEQWGLRQNDGKPVSRSTFYKSFTNIFYTGKYFYFAGVLYDNGIHEPMITPDEFELVQKILGKHGKPFQTKRIHAFTNWLMCPCGSSISANERFRRYCYTCKDKFNAEKYDLCPKCASVPSTRLIHTITYQCTRKKDPKCRQPSVSESCIVEQIEKVLKSIELSDAYVKWGLAMLKKDNEEEITKRQAIQENLQRQVVGITKRIDNLTYKFTSEENINGELFSDIEYKNIKNRLIQEKAGFENELVKLSKNQIEWTVNAEKAFKFCRYASYWFKNGTKKQRRAIFQAISSNPRLDNKIVKYDVLKPFQVIQKIVKSGFVWDEGLEPQEYVDKSIQTVNSNPLNPLKSG